MVATIRPNERGIKKENSFKEYRPSNKAGGDFKRNNNTGFEKKGTYNNAGFGKRSNHKEGGFERRGSYNNAYEDMDDDSPRNGARNNKPRELVKPKLPPDQQPDKYEAKKRLEREKKVVQRKLMDEESDREKRPTKHKNSSKTNWTKNYQVGMLDEDEYTD